MSGPGPGRRRTAAAVGLVWLFAACFLLIARVDRVAPPPSERVNDGSRATFFVVHASPYYTVSEDFHLYVVRSKRIMDRGWTRAPLHDADAGRAGYVAPVQALLMMLAVKTDGRPVPYSFFVAAVYGTAWTILLLAAIAWMPRAVSPIAIAAAVLVTALFEAPRFLLAPSADFGQWPVYRGFRMATMAWARPVMLAVTIAAMSLAVRAGRRWPRAVFVAVGLATLGAADSWSFLVAAFSAGLVAAGIAMFAAAAWWRRAPWRAHAWTAAALAVAVASGVAVNLVSNTLPADAMTRGGVGPAWRDSPARLAATYGLRNTLVVCAVIGLAAFVVVTLRRDARRRRLHARVFCRRPLAGRLYLCLALVIPLGAVMILRVLLSRFGVEAYSAEQLVWRRDFLLLFALMILAFALCRYGGRCVLGPRGWARVASPAIAVAIALFLGYHAYRIHGFVTGTAAREYFLTADQEALRAWLEEHERAHPRNLIATASHELNYLAAYWTRADLLLPEGFPYHSVETNDVIERRMARLLSVYRATPERWLAFNLHRHPSDQWAWADGRVRSARYGYMYYLLHRGVSVRGVAGAEFEPRFDSPTARFVASYYAMMSEQRIAGIESAERIARLLATRDFAPASASDPDVIIVDDVSRELGDPDVSGYTRAFARGSLEAWVRVASTTARAGR